MTQWIKRSLVRLVDYPWATALLVVVVTALSLVGRYDPTLRWLRGDAAEEVEAWPPETSVADRPGARVAPPIEPFALTEADSIVLAQSDHFFTPFGARALRHVVEQLEALDHVHSVLWMDRAPPLNLFGLPEPIFPRSDAAPQRFEAAREQALRNPLIVGQLLSPDARNVLLMVRFDWLGVRDDEDVTTRLRETAERAVADVLASMPESLLPEGLEPQPIRFEVTGRVPIYLMLARSSEENEFKYQVIAYAMILGLAIVLFRGIAAVLVTALAPAVGVYWTLGFLSFWDIQDNPFNEVILPILLSLIGFTDGVHLMVHIRKMRAAGLSVRQAVRRGIVDVGLACALTSLTTAVGFASLMWAHHEVVRQFGWCCVIGVGLTFLAVVTVIPLACLSPLGRRIDTGHSRGLVDQHLDRIGWVVDAVLRHNRRMAALAILVTFVLIAVASTLRPDSHRTSALPQGSEAMQGLKKMDRALGGLETGRVEIHWDPALEDDSAEIAEVTQKVDAVLRGEPLIGHPLSIVNLLRALPGESPVTDRMPMLELLPPPLKRAFYTPERHQALVIFRVQDLGIARYGPVFLRVEAEMAEIAAQHPRFYLRLTGSPVERWRDLYQVVVDLATSLGSASLVIFLILTVVYRSLRLGLISIIPNLFPLAATASVLVFTGQSLELVSVCAFTVCLGIAVDDTIHFLTRYTEERKQCVDEAVAIRRAFVGVGTALVVTTVVLIAGFSTVLLSDTRDHRIFALMGGLTIGSALLADLIFLPALLVTFSKRSSDAE